MTQQRKQLGPTEAFAEKNGYAFTQNLRPEMRIKVREVVWTVISNTLTSKSGSTEIWRVVARNDAGAESSWNHYGGQRVPLAE